jgi:Holliday junction resolvase RusA-like endonuclease
MIHTWIPGHPRTKGSLDERHQDTPLSKKWRQMMAYALDRARRAEVITAGAAVAVRAVFFLPTGDPTMPQCGDLDKLARNLLDAGTDATVYADDVQVVRLFVDKVADRQCPGVLISIWAPSRDEIASWTGAAWIERHVAMSAQGLLS